MKHIDCIRVAVSLPQLLGGAPTSPGSKEQWPPLNLLQEFGAGIDSLPLLKLA